jgi:hypothetical protein
MTTILYVFFDDIWTINMAYLADVFSVLNELYFKQQGEN